MLDCGGGGLLDAEIDPLAEPVAIARQQRAHDRDRAVAGRRMIGLQAQRPHRLAAGVAVDVEHPGQRRHDGVVGLEVAIRPGLPERRDRAEDQRGIVAMQVIPSKAELRDRARREAFDDHVGRSRQRADNFRAPPSSQIERQRALIEIVEPEKQAAVAIGKVVDERADSAARLALGWLDLDYVRAHVGEDARAERSPMGRQIENAQPGERPVRSPAQGRRVGALPSPSIANGLRSRVGAISWMTSPLGPVRSPPRRRMVSKVSGFSQRTPSTAGLAWPSSSTGSRAGPT